MLFSVDLVLEHLGGLEHGGVAGSDVDSRAVGRVTALMLITVLAGEDAEASSQGIHDGVEHAIHDSGDVFLGQLVLSSHFLISSVLFIIIVSFKK